MREGTGHVTVITSITDLGNLLEELDEIESRCIVNCLKQKLDGSQVDKYWVRVVSRSGKKHAWYNSNSWVEIKFE